LPRAAPQSAYEGRQVKFAHVEVSHEAMHKIDHLLAAQEVDSMPEKCNYWRARFVVLPTPKARDERGWVDGKGAHDLLVALPIRMVTSKGDNGGELRRRQRQRHQAAAVLGGRAFLTC